WTLDVRRLLPHSHAFAAHPAACSRSLFGVAAYHLRAVIADRFDRASFHRFFTKSFFLRRLRLFVDIRMASVVVPLEIRGSGFAAQIAVDALIVYVEFARYVFGVFVSDIGHGFYPEMKRNVRKKRSQGN